MPRFFASKILFGSAAFCTALAIAAPNPTSPQAWTESYNVAWTSPSHNSSESMPCGGGGIGLNVWVENGDLLIYLSRSGTYDELNGMPKLGRLRVTLSPNPFADGTVFRQELKLPEGDVEIRGEKDGLKARLDVWVDVFHPVVHIAVDTNEPTSVTAAYESWRLNERRQETKEMGANRSYLGAPEPAIVRPDQVDFTGAAVRFVHHNEGRTAFDLVVAQQGLESVKNKLWNPLADLTFGGSLSGNNFVPAGTRDGKYASTPFRAWQLRSSQPARRHELQAVLHVASAPQLADWAAGLEKIARAARVDPRADRARTQTWWDEFWARSHIVIDPDKPDPASPAWQVGRNYQLFRYQLGCNANGLAPTKFNGGLFTFDPEYVDPDLDCTPDFRKWGGGSFTAQNQRLVYWPMLKSGDFDLMNPQFDFYLNALGNAEARSALYWKIPGANFTEQIENFGLPVAFEYNWKRQPGVDPGLEDSVWVNYEWDTVFEFCQMILDQRVYAATDISAYLPLIQSCLNFYDEFYQQQERKRTGQPFDREGKLVLFPATAGETYKDALNPSTTVAALNRVLASVVALPESLLPTERRQHWQTMLDRLPALSFREMDGHRVIAPAAQWSRIQNVELPQLYPVFPWGFHGIGRPDLAVAIDTWKYGVDQPAQGKQKNFVSWHQDAIFCARLGLTDEAAEITLKKMQDAGRRFPTWWGPGHDWVPDHNWGGSGMIGLQEMLLQTADEKIYLLPAWPKTWNVRFKLHAPHQTIVEGEVQAGRLVSYRVTPAERKKDVVISESWK